MGEEGRRYGVDESVIWWSRWDGGCFEVMVALEAMLCLCLCFIGVNKLITVPFKPGIEVKFIAVWANWKRKREVNTAAKKALFRKTGRKNVFLFVLFRWIRELRESERLNESRDRTGRLHFRERLEEKKVRSLWDFCACIGRESWSAVKQHPSPRVLVLMRTNWLYQVRISQQPLYDKSEKEKAADRTRFYQRSL